MDAVKVTDVRVEKGDSAFLIDDGNTAILYDTGFGFTGFGVAENIKTQLANRPLDYIFLTHSHYDHALGSAYILRYYPDAKVVAGKYASEIFKRDGAKRVMRELDQKFAEKCGVYDYEFLGDELRVDIPVSDGQVIKAGDMEFEVLELPGHTKCSVGFYCKQHLLFLSSETIGVYDGGELIVPSYLVSYSSSLAAIDRVISLDIKWLLAPHLGILDELQTDFFLKNAKMASEQAADFIISRVKRGLTNEEIIEEFKQRYRRGYIAEIYPEDAIELNTNIMIELLKKELLLSQED